MEQSNSTSRTTFSVVIPLYQKRHRIEACLASVKAQTFYPLEVIVVDDGSTDGGGELVQEIGSGWVRYVRQKNSGVSAARNHGISLAEGVFVAFLDADDTWRPDHLATLAQLSHKYPQATILGTGWTERGSPVSDPALTADDQVVSLQFFLRCGVLGRHLFATPAVAAQRKCAVGMQLFPVGSRIAEDQDAWITLLEMGSGVRSRQVTVDVFDDPISPTMNIPSPKDFESVIFLKWKEEELCRSSEFAHFVAAHRLFTIQRHIGYSANGFLLKQLLDTRPGALSIRGLGVLLRMFMQAIGVLPYLKNRRHRRSA